MNRLRSPVGRLLRGVANDWQPLLDDFAASDTGRALCAAVDARVAAGAAVYPGTVFRALELTPLAATRIVILGQDPYHGAGQAEGLAFSVPAGQRPPPSLRNILREWHRDLGLAMPASGSLARWAEQGVLLLNTALTVEGGAPGSHSSLGWHALTSSMISAVARSTTPKAFLLWGAHAQSFAPWIVAAGSQHQVLQCNHPSPLSAARGPVPFVGCGHFGLADRFLQALGQPRQDWSLA